MHADRRSVILLRCLVFEELLISWKCLGQQATAIGGSNYGHRILKPCGVRTSRRTGKASTLSKGFELVAGDATAYGIVVQINTRIAIMLGPLDLSLRFPAPLPWHCMQVRSSSGCVKLDMVFTLLFKYNVVPTCQRHIIVHSKCLVQCSVCCKGGGERPCRLPQSIE